MAFHYIFFSNFMPSLVTPVLKRCQIILSPNCLLMPDYTALPGILSVNWILLSLQAAMKRADHLEALLEQQRKQLLTAK